MAFWYANPSIYFLLLIQVRLAGGTLLVIIGKEVGYILGRLPVWCTFTPMANLESPTNLTTMFLQYGGKNHREPIQIRRECADLTKKGPSLDLKTTVWRHGVNCITMSPYINPIGKFVTNHCCKNNKKTTYLTIKFLQGLNQIEIVLLIMMKKYVNRLYLAHEINNNKNNNST